MDLTEVGGPKDGSGGDRGIREIDLTTNGVVLSGEAGSAHRQRPPGTVAQSAHVRREGFEPSVTVPATAEDDQVKALDVDSEVIGTCEVVAVPS